MKLSVEGILSELHLDATNSDIDAELVRQENDLMLLRAFLRDAAERSRDLILERQIKELVYDLEEIRRSWSIRMAAVTSTNTICGRYPRDTVGRALASEIRSIKNDRIQPMLRVIKGFADLGLVQQHSTKANEIPSVQLNKEVPPIGIKSIVGLLENEANNLISSLVEKTEKVDVISIIGMPGLGKTTLAWKIYQNKKIRQEFPTRIWVDIPQDFTLKYLLRNILKELFVHGMIDHKKLVINIPQESCSKDSFVDILNDSLENDRISDESLMDVVRECLEKSRFLLVLDAIWTANTLQSITHFLPKNGKVLITSSNTSACVGSNISREPHMMRFLNEKESWDLLQLEVFGMLGECPEMLKSTGECIAKNCDGLPLAIVSIASSLMVTSSTLAAEYLNEKWWKKVSENIIVYATDFDQQRVFRSVELSYISLPQCLRDCFLYLGVFPGGHEIPVWTLTRLWIAEGLVQNNSRRGLSLEETAENNLYDLVNRNLVVVGKRYPNGQIKTCALHKLIYGFCKYKAAEQDFYHEIKIFKGGALDCPMPLTPNHRRLCIASCLSEFLSCGPKGQFVRSILCLNKADEEVLHPKSGSNIHKSFKLLKIFECKRIKFAKFPTKLSKLISLRYISLSCDDLDVIPEAISSLLYLETMVVYTQSPSLKLKANIWRMPQLQHLVTKAAIVLAIRGRGEGGQNLQTLTRLAPECCEDVFRRAPNLNRLGVRGESTALLSSSSLNKFERLQHLKLINESSPPEIQLQPAPQCFPPNLKSLTLSATYLGWDSISILENINTLEILKLKNNAFKGTSWNTNARGFCGLVFLSIRTADLVSWEASSADCFPRLKELVLKDCKYLKKIPSTLARTLNTMDVDVESVSASAVESARAINQQITQRQG